MTRLRRANGATTPSTTRESIIEVIANTTPQEMAIQCRIPKLRLTTLPANCRVGRTAKTVGASTKAKKMSPPIHTTSDSSIKYLTKDIATSGGTAHCKWRCQSEGSDPSRNRKREPRWLPFPCAYSLAQPQSTEPPFTLRTSPVMWRAQSEPRNTMALATSSASAIRCNGIACSTSCLYPLVPGPKTGSFNSVSTQPGATQFTRMLGANSMASDFAKLICPPFDAA